MGGRPYRHGSTCWLGCQLKSPENPTLLHTRRLRSFVAPPNVRALELDVHFKQSSDHEGLATLVRPFGATLEHLCLRIGAYGVEEGAYADFVEFWNDRTATSLLKLCPRLRRLDFPVEVSRRVGPWRVGRNGSAPRPRDPRGLRSPRRASSRRWRRTCGSGWSRTSRSST